MQHYYVNENAQPTGEHEVHEAGCVFMPEIQNRRYLGYFSNAIEACREARKIYSKVDGCYYCAEEAHRR